MPTVSLIVIKCSNFGSIFETEMLILADLKIFQLSWLPQILSYVTFFFSFPCSSQIIKRFQVIHGASHGPPSLCREREGNLWRTPGTEVPSVLQAKRNCSGGTNLMRQIGADLSRRPSSLMVALQQFNFNPISVQWNISKVFVIFPFRKKMQHIWVDDNFENNNRRSFLNFTHSFIHDLLLLQILFRIRYIYYARWKMGNSFD